jgi:undecaprenyl-diphosphatase
VPDPALFVVPAITRSQHPLAYGEVIDWAIFHAVNTWVATREWIEDPTSVLSGLVVPLYALATVALWFAARPYGSMRLKLASVSGLIAAAIALLANQAASDLWVRPRPFVDHPALTHVLAARTSDPSFPSDHAAAAFAIAFAVFAFSRRVGAAFLVAATLIGLSRIALGMHYPSDVLVGMLVGLASAALVTTFGQPWTRRIVVFLSGVSDPLLRPVWVWFRRVVPVSRF